MPAKLYKKDLNPPARAAIMACEIFNVPVEMVDVNLLEGEHLTPEYLKMNPCHTIPVFVDGDFVIHDSHAMLMYFADTYGNNSPLYPKDIKQRTLINQKLFFNDGVLFTRLRIIANPAFVRGVKGVTKMQLDDLQETYDFLEAFLSRHKFLALDHITIADIAAYATVCMFHYIVPLDTDKYPKLAAWLKEMEKQPYCQKYNAAGAKAFGELLKSVIESK
ncbi:hypothetical protein ABMA28_015743 [Loxostege sticticalis]|uniref:Uncharacterized protein n=1 Tax=Loxostege sticticalis TaxID=481309 RepID=A0ABD0TAV9_LOXSC